MDYLRHTESQLRINDVNTVSVHYLNTICYGYHHYLKILNILEWTVQVFLSPKILSVSKYYRGHACIDKYNCVFPVIIKMGKITRSKNIQPGAFINIQYTVSVNTCTGVLIHKYPLTFYVFHKDDTFVHFERYLLHVN